ncbi:MAG: response regulator [Pseudomonadota bacterium]
MNAHVLLIEDDALDREFILRAMSRTTKNIKIVVAEDGASALEILRNEPPPSVIVTDLSMPRMDGHELLQALKSDDSLKKIPAIVLSTADGEDVIEACYAEHCNAYLVKPASIKDYDRIADRIQAFWLEEVRLPH